MLGLAHLLMLAAGIIHLVVKSKITAVVLIIVAASNLVIVGADIYQFYKDKDKEE